MLGFDFMLNRITLRNFQAHQDRTIEFDQTTTIVGPSDKGKTAIVRALYWLFFNRPARHDFIRRGTTSCSVEVEIDGRSIKRSKGKQNVYEIDGEKLVGFSTRIPDPVQELAKIGEVNFQLQHDPYYWIGMTGGQVYQQICKLTGLDRLTSALKHIRKKKSDCRSVIAFTKKKLEDQESRLKELEWAESARKDLDAIQRIQSDLEEKQEELDQLEECINQYRELIRLERKASEIVGKIDRILRLSTELERKRSELDRIETCVNRLKRIKQEESDRKAELNDLEKELEQLERGFCPTCKRPL